jgi:hypothetical protein
MSIILFQVSPEEKKNYYFNLKINVNFFFIENWNALDPTSYITNKADEPAPAKKWPDRQVYDAYDILNLV